MSDIVISTKTINTPPYESYYSAIFHHQYKTIAPHLIFLGDSNRKGMNILDFGCGEGIAALRFALEHPDANVYGCDITNAFNRIEVLAKKRVRSRVAT